jgi:UDP:flavonoid glycosyltransferase YjiC (YdhE family)
MPVQKRNIAIFPLQWGLGHAGRMLPLAVRLRDLGHNVYIASSSEHISFFRREAAGFQYIESKSFTIRYSKTFPQWLVIVGSLHRLLWYTVKEHFELKRIIKENSIDIVISDSRPGLWNSKVRTAFVSHLPGIPLPWFLLPLSYTGNLVGRMILRKYDLFFIPDLPGDVNLAGKLSHLRLLPNNARYCGILSRFIYSAADSTGNRGQYVLAILSGPEPQRFVFMDKIISLCERLDRELIILGASPGERADTYDPLRKIRYISHADTTCMTGLITASDVIITRSGYTSLMELTSLKKSAIIVPTPGQSEQEYLARYLHRRGWFRMVRQSELDYTDDLSVPGTGLPDGLMEESENLLKSCIDELLKD